ncbi:hypothetical protein C8P64_1859 [Christiangramia gaetbulicola]|uniref:Matrixin n=1 Tax=Christiangramia gaetbulicola TaxID=703340 RepID=A0A2T6AHR0_9FLAO|nr:hypothetical protein [Christiangramia gaetbulicola]PTX43332.1 hypothetical protein C8P64_1859 [Christiangramia gaetbulicola]
MRTISLKLLILALVLVSCNKDSEVDQGDLNPQELNVKPIFVDVDFPVYEVTNRTKAQTTQKPNQKFVRLAMAEYITSSESGKIGNTVFFNNRGKKQLSFDFLPFDPLDGTPDISYYIDETRPTTDISLEISTNAIQRAMATWDDLTCSELGLFEFTPEGQLSSGYVAKLVYDIGLIDQDLGGSYDYFGDVVHSGWLPAEFFDIELIFGPGGGSNSVIGVTFTIQFTDEQGNPIDLDNNGKFDVAWREIYYNENFTWNDGNTVDIESIALHEAGHGLSQAHFGKLFRTDSNGKFHFSPRAVMNAGYVGGTYTEVQATDNAGHCSNWASWPEN